MATKKKTTKKTNIDPNNPDPKRYYMIKEDELTPGMLVHWQNENTETAMFLRFDIDNNNNKTVVLNVNGKIGTVDYNPMFWWYVQRT